MMSEEGLLPADGHDFDLWTQEAYAELDKVESEVRSKNARIARVLRKMRGSYWFYKGFRRFIEGNMILDEWEIARELPTNAEHRKTNECGPIREYWQTTWNGSPESDLLIVHGYVQVKDNRWVKVAFSS